MINIGLLYLLIADLKCFVLSYCITAIPFMYAIAFPLSALVYFDLNL